MTEPVPWSWKESVLAVVVYVSGQIIIGTLLWGAACLSLRLMDPGVLRSDSDLMMAGFQVSIGPTLLAAAGLIICYLAWSISRVHHRPVLASLGLLRPRGRDVIAWAAAGSLLAVTLAGLMLLVPPEESETGGMLTELAESGTSGWIVWLGLALLIAPVVEELVFRGYVYPGVRGALGPAGAGLLVSAVFALMHAGEVGLYLPALGGVMLLALMLSFIREHTGNLYCCIVCHLAYNLTLALLSWPA